MSEGSEAIGVDDYTENATLTTTIRDSSPQDYSGFLSYNLIFLHSALVPYSILNSVSGKQYKVDVYDRVV